MDDLNAVSKYCSSVGITLKPFDTSERVNDSNSGSVKLNKKQLDFIKSYYSEDFKVYANPELYEIKPY